MASTSVTPARKHRLQTLETIGENGERQWLLIGLSPTTKKFMEIYDKLAPDVRALTDTVIGAVASHVLTPAQIDALDRAGSREAMREWTATITPAQRVRIDQVWAEAQS